MAKKRKKGKGKRVAHVEPVEPVAPVQPVAPVEPVEPVAHVEPVEPETMLNEEIDSASKASSSLQGLLQRVTEGTSFFHRKTEEDDLIEPQLSYEKKKLVEEYLMESVPISERPLSKRRAIITEQKSITEKEIPLIKKEPSITELESPLPTVAPKEDNVYDKLAIFFEGFLGGYNERYERWENSISNILSVLRKMRKITKKNTEDLVSNITNTFTHIEDYLEQFKIKRDQMEKISGINVQSMSGEFKKVLGLLELQIKEYQLKKVVDEYIHTKNLFN